MSICSRNLPLPLVPILCLCPMLLLGCAAHRHTEQGRAALAVDDPLGARHHFARALEHDPKLSAKPRFAEDYRLARRDAALLEAGQAMRRGEPVRAIERYEAALRFEPGLEVAAAGLVEAKSAAADAAHLEAQEYADRGDLDAARRRLDEALGHKPGHVGAGAAMRSLSASDEQAPAVYRDASASEAARDWDAALSGYRRAVVREPDFLPARAAIPAALDAAAEDYLGRGRSLREAGRLDEAEAALARVLDYRPEHPRLEAERGRVDLAWGDRHLAGGRPGAAWVAYREARQHARETVELGSGEADRGSAEAERRIRDLHRVALNVVPGFGGDARLTEPLVERVRQRLSEDAAAAIGLNADGQRVVIGDTELDLPPAVVRRQNREHAYTVEVDVPNPELPRLQQAIAQVDRDIDHLLLDLRRLERRYHHLQGVYTGEPGCVYHHEFHGVQRKLRAVRRDLRDCREEHRRLTHLLVTEPPFLTELQTAYWPFVVATHRRESRLTATLRFEGVPSADAITAEATDSDEVTEGARPDLGLPEDPLELPSDQVTVDELLDRAAARVQRSITQHIGDRRDAALAGEAERLADTDPVAAREARIARRVLAGNP